MSYIAYLIGAVHSTEVYSITVHICANEKQNLDLDPVISFETISKIPTF